VLEKKSSVSANLGQRRKNKEKNGKMATADRRNAHQAEIGKHDPNTRNPGAGHNRQNTGARTDRQEPIN